MEEVNIERTKKVCVEEMKMNFEVKMEQSQEENIMQIQQNDIKKLDINSYENKMEESREEKRRKAQEMKAIEIKKMDINFESKVEEDQEAKKKKAEMKPDIEFAGCRTKRADLGYMEQVIGTNGGKKQCAVCEKMRRAVKMLMCKHTVCAVCVEKMMEKSGFAVQVPARGAVENGQEITVECPVCKAQLDSKDLYYIGPRVDDPPKLMWEKNDLQSGTDVLFTPVGNIAVIDPNKEHMVLYSPDGVVLADTNENDFKLTCSSAVAYHHRENAILVTEWKQGNVIFLNPNDLKHRKTVQLEGICKPCGIAVLSNGYLVVTEKFTVKGKVSVHSIDGKLIREWASGAKYSDSINSIAVDSQDNITLCIFNDNKTVRFSRMGDILQEITLDRGMPVAVTAASPEQLLLATWNPYRIHLLSPAHPDKDDVLLDFCKSLKGYLNSVAIQGSRMALVFSHSVQIYDYKL